ncbi:MAG: MFS transporter [Propionibacteriaceae bacterium]|nr:MFS transporter [Propionibacteriaceae bacterium]
MSEGYRPGEPGYRRVAVALFLAGLATFALVHAPQPLLPELAADFVLSPGQAMLSVSATMVGLGLALLIAGPGTEVLGRTPLIFASLFTSAVVALACSLAPSWPVLIVLRAVQGVALAGLPAVATAYLREEVHPSATSRAVGLYIGGTAIGGMSGRLIAGILGDALGWRFAFAALGTLALGCAITAWWLLPPSRRFVPASPQPREVLGGAFRALREPGLVCLYCVSGTLMGGFVAVFNALGFRLTAEPYGLPLAVSSLVFVTYAVGSVSAGGAGALADRHGYARVLLWAMVLALAGLGLTAAAPLPLVIVGVVVFTAGFFAAHGVASGWVAIRASQTGNGPGQAASFYLFSYYLGAGVLGGLAGPAWSAGAWPGVLALVGGLWVLTLGLAVLLGRLTRAA